MPLIRTYPTMTPIIPDRRHVMILGASFLLSSCGFSPVSSTVFRTLKIAAAGLPDVPLTREQITKIPYATLSAKIGKGPTALLVLARKDADYLYWVSADRATLVTKHGRIVETAGFPENLRATTAQEQDPVADGLHRLDGPVSFSRSVDIDLNQSYGLRIDSLFEPLGPKQISIVGLDFKTLLVRERNDAQTLNWRFYNYYWVDIKDGFVWKSRQHIARNFPPLVFEILKPAA